jgi:hypothetical protein
MALDRRFSVIRTRLLIVWHSAAVTGLVIAHRYASRADRMAAAPARHLAIGKYFFRHRCHPTVICKAASSLGQGPEWTAQRLPKRHIIVDCPYRFRVEHARSYISGLRSCQYVRDARDARIE